MLAAIWAQDEEGTIGKENRLPWHLPNDLKFFKQMTEDNTIVMGRKTFEGMGSRPLPNRQTIVLTRDREYQAKGLSYFIPLKKYSITQNHFQVSLLFQVVQQFMRIFYPIVTYYIVQLFTIHLKGIPNSLLLTGMTGH